MITRYLFVAILFALTVLAVTPATHAQAPFITTWKTDNPGASDPDQITIPTAPGETYNYDVYWEDVTAPTTNGTITGATGELTITFPAAGTYSVEISGDFPRIYFWNDGAPSDTEKILTVEQWGDIAWSSMEFAFRSANNLVVNATDAPDLSGVTSTRQMFFGATSMNSDLNHWDVSSVTDMGSMFQQASSFNQPLGSWDVSSVTNMQRMFAEASAFDQDLSTWDVSNVTDMSGMFGGATSFDQDISGWDVSNVMYMSTMFFGTGAFNQDIGGWNVSSVVDMYGMFNGASAFDQDISGWDVSSVTDMEFMFRETSTFNPNVGTWDVGNVTNMRGMFYEATAFNQDISSWNVSNVTDMELMFLGASAFNQDIGSWDVSSVADMEAMFLNASAFNQDISGWNVGNVTTMANMLNGSGLSTENYDTMLIGWAGQTVQPSVPFGASGLEYCAGADARQTLMDPPNNWTFFGDSAGDCAVPSNVAGWRMLTVPGGGLSVQDLADRNLVQGLSDSYPGADANLFVNYDGPTNADYTAASSTSDALEPGRGFLWYLYDDTDFSGTPPPEFVDIESFSFPGELGTAQTADVTVAFTAIPATSGSDVPAYMFGNPFRDAFQLSGVSVDNGTLQTNFSAWDPTAASYVTLGPTDYVSAWQGLWAEVDGGTTAPEFMLAFSSVDPSETPPFIGLRTDRSFTLDLRLDGTFESGKPVADLANRIRFEPDAMLAWDRHDGSKFSPPLSTDGYALLSLEGVRQSGAYRQAVRSLPSGLDETVTIPVSLLSGETGEFTLSAEAVNLPEGWSATLRDLETDTETNLLEARYAFSGAAGEDWQNRFEITITPPSVAGSEGGSTELRLSNPAPNPATRSTALILQVPEAQHVTARVFDALGRRVATAFENTLTAGEEIRLTIDATSLAAGTYVVRVEGETFAETRRFTVIR